MCRPCIKTVNRTKDQSYTALPSLQQPYRLEPAIYSGVKVQIYSVWGWAASHRVARARPSADCMQCTIYGKVTIHGFGTPALPDSGTPRLRDSGTPGLRDFRTPWESQRL